MRSFSVIMAISPPCISAARDRALIPANNLTYWTVGSLGARVQDLVVELGTAQARPALGDGAVTERQRRCVARRRGDRFERGVVQARLALGDGAVAERQERQCRRVARRCGDNRSK